MAVDSAGNSVMASTFGGTVDFDPGAETTELNSADGYGYLAKYKPDGTFEWVQQYAGATGDIAFDSRGDIYAVGWFRNSIQFGPFQFVESGDGYNSYIVKYSASGQVLWAERFQSSKASGIAFDESGSMYVTGELCGTGQFGSFTLANSGGNDAFVVKMQAEDGEVLWGWHTMGPACASGQALAVGPDDGVYVAGDFGCFLETMTIGNYTLTKKGEGDVFLAKLDPTSSEVVWAYRMGGTVFTGSTFLGDGARGLAFGPDGLLYLTGFFSETADFGSQVLTSNGGTDVFAAKIDPSDGAVIWARGMGGEQQDSVYSHGPAFDAEGNFYFTGDFKAIADFDPASDRVAIRTSFYLDGFLVKLDSDGNYCRVWQMGGDGSTATRGYANGTDSAGTAYVAGRFRGTVDFPVGSLTSTMTDTTDVFMMSLAPQAVPSEPPVARPDTYSYWMNYRLDVPVLEGVLVNDTDQSDSLSATVVTGPSYGKVTLHPNGSFQYEPDANYVGTDSFTYQANDTQGFSSNAEVSIEVKTIPTIVTYASTDVPKGIPDLGQTLSTITIAEPFTITNVDVQINIAHARDPDLDAFLIAPDGTRIELFTDVGTTKSVNFTNTRLDDEATVSITSGKAPFAGTFRPEGKLSMLYGKTVTGTWTLEVSDDSKKQTGIVNAWSLIITPLVPGPIGAEATVSESGGGKTGGLAASRSAAADWVLAGLLSADAEQASPWASVGQGMKARHPSITDLALLDIMRV